MKAVCLRLYSANPVTAPQPLLSALYRQHRNCCRATHLLPSICCQASVAKRLLLCIWCSPRHMCGCRGDKAVEYSRKLEYLKREEELIKEEELEAEALLQPSAQTLQVPLQPLGPLLLLAAVQHSPCQCVCTCKLGLLSASKHVLHTMQCVTTMCRRHAYDT